MQVSELIQKAQTIVDCDGNKKAVQLDYATWEELLESLGASTEPQAAAGDRPLRPVGLCEGEFTVPDDFDDPLPEEVIRGFEGR